MVMQLSSVVLSPPPTPPSEGEQDCVPHKVTHEHINKDASPHKPPRNSSVSPQKPHRTHKKPPPPPPPRSNQTKLESHIKLLSLEECAKTHQTLKKNKPGPFSRNAEEYFKGVSPMCRRLLDDMASVRDSVGEDWHDLSYEQQCKMLDQAIVDEATVRMYEHSAGATPRPDCQYFPKLQVHTGQNVIRDEMLSERGFNCTWRDEHSAPFSWHTRSQMDLTIDTPPETPMESQGSSSNGTGSYALIGNAVDTTDGATNRNATFTSHPQKKSHRADKNLSAFTWHYEPSPRPIKTFSQDVPDVVVVTAETAEDLKKKKSKHRRSISMGGGRAHVIVKTDDVDEQPTGFLGKLRGAFCKLTSSCMPMHPGTPILSHSIPSDTSSPPELRPAHVLAQANAVSQGVSVTDPITTPIFSSLNNNALLSAENNHGGGVSPSSTTFSINENEKHKTNSYNKYNKKKHAPPPPPVRKSSTTLSKPPVIPKQSTSNGLNNENLNELLKKKVIDEIKLNGVSLKQVEKETKMEQVHFSKKQEPIPVDTSDVDDYMMDTSSTDDNSIPKTGFDFLDNW